MTKRLFSIIFLLFVSVLVLAQDKPKPYQIDLDRADDAFITKRYNTAAQFYQKVYSKVKDTEEMQFVLFRIAESYRYSNILNKPLSVLKRF